MSISFRRLALVAGLAALLFNAQPAAARVKLITLPVRERVEIQLDNPNATLVEEERIVPLVKGENQVDFSWANTQIDPNTIVFRVIGPGGDKPVEEVKEPGAEPVPAGTEPGGVEAADPAAAPVAPMEVKVLSVSYPPNEAALIWNIAASQSGSARVRISYLLGALTKSFNYRAVAARDESTLVLAQYIRLQNLANEDFGGAGLWAGFGQRFLKPIGINETKEMLMEKFENVPIQKTYTCNPAEFDYLDRPQNKLRVPMHYVLKNDKEHKLGVAALPFGKVRIFIESGGKDQPSSTAFLGEDWGKFTPIDDEMRLYLGVAQDIVVKRTIEKNEMKQVAGNLYNREVVIKYEIENFKDKPVTLDVAENLRHIRNEVLGDTGRDVEWELGGETTFEGGADAEKSNFEQVLFHVKLPARDAAGKAEKITHKLHVTIKNEW